jgi:CRP-like cAMP-binding protein
METSMKLSPVPELLASAVIARLSALAPLDQEEIGAIQSAARLARHHRQHREVQVDRQSARQFLMLSGWACQARTFADGRRQILNLLLPGDLFSTVRQYEPTTDSAIVTFTDAVTCAAPMISPEAERPGLADAYLRSRALREAYLFRHIARLGRLNALERMADWLLEIRERLNLAGLADGARFPLPLTQEALGDTLGLTSVHVNRTLQAMRREGLIDLRSGTVVLLDPDSMASLVSYHPVSIPG